MTAPVMLRASGRAVEGQRDLVPAAARTRRWRISAAAAGARRRWHELDTGHYPMLSEPAALARPDRRLIVAARRIGPILQRSRSARCPRRKRLAELEADVARDLELTAHPRAPWLVPKTSGGAPVLDCLVIGAGQCGLAVAHRACSATAWTTSWWWTARRRGGRDPGSPMPACATCAPRRTRSARTSSCPPSPTRPGTRRSGAPRHFAAMPWIPKERWQDYLRLVPPGHRHPGAQRRRRRRDLPRPHR